MKFIFLILFALSLRANDQKALGPEAFQSSARPVLAGILNDFYQMITLFPDFPKELISIVDEIDDLHGAKENLREKCPRYLTNSCLESINALRVRLSSIQAKTLKLVANQKISSNLNMNPLGGMRTTNQFQLGLEEIKGELDNSSLIIKAGASDKKATYPIIKKIDELSTYISLTVVEYIPFLYQDEFRHFYFTFIHPVQQQISKHKNYEFLNKNINSLNFSLNLLNQSLTKRNKKTPEGMAPYLLMIHNRWNSLFRYYL